VEQHANRGRFAIAAHAEHFTAIAEDDQASAPNIAKVAGLDLVSQPSEGRGGIAVVRLEESDDFRNPRCLGQYPGLYEVVLPRSIRGIG